MNMHTLIERYREQSPEFKNCYSKLYNSNRKLTRRIKGRMSPSRRKSRDASERSITNKCIKKLKLNYPLLKPSDGVRSKSKKRKSSIRKKSRSKKRKSLRRRS